MSTQYRDMGDFLSEKGIELNALADYFKAMGVDLFEQLDRFVVPLTDVNGRCPYAVFNTMRLKSQQAAMVNGIDLLFKKSKYGFMTEDMGCGKTIQAIAVLQKWAANLYMNTHPGATLQDAYKDGGIKARHIIMCPSHIAGKWAAEIKEQVPHARVKIIKSLADLEEIKRNGKKRYANEWFVISKETAKLSYTEMPAPTKCAWRKVKVEVCADCLNPEITKEPRDVIRVNPDDTCSRCGGRNFTKKTLYMRGSDEYIHGDYVYGLTCPECNELLLDPSLVGRQMYREAVLGPGDFADKSKRNCQCYHCGSSLWVPAVKNIGAAEKEKKAKGWKKISHYTNMSRKGRTTDFVLEGHENAFFNLNPNVPLSKEGDISYARVEGSRKVSLARYILKHMKGYFDFCVLDEVHQYEGDGTAQSNAAHCLIRSSKRTLCLTGTLMNGKASSLYYLLYMLDPRKMLEMGYKYSDKVKFTQEYGSFESVSEIDDSSYNKSSRGKKNRRMKEKPGISPQILPDFLLEKQVCLHIEDFSDILPRYNEIVRVVPLEPELKGVYDNVASQIKGCLREMGMAAVSASLKLLTLTDNISGFKDILDPKTGNVMIRIPENPLSEDTLTNKEMELVSIVNSEISEGRNCFVYVQSTGGGDGYIPDRIKWVIENSCGLKGKVMYIDASSPNAEKRMDYIHKQAKEKGIKVFICNPRLVETGVDFIWNEDGVTYNYPTIIFYQIGTQLSTLWQASRRAYRLIQTEECRTYYIVSEGTMQTTLLDLMGDKRAATAAIQGDLSQGALNTGNEDVRIKLARSISEGIETDTEEMKAKFATKKRNLGPSIYAGFGPTQIYSELMGYDDEVENILDEMEVIDVADDEDDLFKAGVISIPEDETPIVEPDDILDELFSGEPVVFSKKSRKRKKSTFVPVPLAAGAEDLMDLDF